MLGTADGAQIHELVHPWAALSLDLARRKRANGAPAVRRGCGGQPEGWRARCAPVRRQHTDVLSANPAADSRSRKAGCLETASPGCVSFGYLSLHRQRKVTRSAGGRAKASTRSTKEPMPAPLDLCSLSPYAYLRAQARLARRSFGATHDPPAQSDVFNTMPMPDKESAREAQVNRRPPVRFHGGRRMVSCGVRLPRSHLSPYGAASALGRRSKDDIFPILHIADYCTWLREQRERMTNQRA